MSVENVVKFYELVASDEGLQDRMQAATDPEAFMAKAVEIGGEQERKTIGTTAEEGRKTIEFTDNIAARGEARSAARSRKLAAR